MAAGAGGYGRRLEANDPDGPPGGLFPTPPAALGFESRRVEVAHGVELHVVDRPGSDPELAPVLFVHGWPDSWRSWQRVLTLLDARRRLIALDLRGFGESSKPEGAGSPYDVPMFARDVAAALDALGVARLHYLVGHSMGSVVAWHFAGSHPARVDHMMLIGSTPIQETRISEAFTQLLQSARGLDAVTYDSVRDFQYSTFNDTSTAGQWYMQTVVHESMRVPLDVWKLAIANLATTRGAGRLLPQIAAKTVVVHGVGDTLMDERNQRDLLRLLPAGAVYREVDHAGHSVQWEEPGARVVASMLVNRSLFAEQPAKLATGNLAVDWMATISGCLLLLLLVLGWTPARRLCRAKASGRMGPGAPLLGRGA